MNLFNGRRRNRGEERKKITFWQRHRKIKTVQATESSKQIYQCYDKKNN